MNSSQDQNSQLKEYLDKLPNLKRAKEEIEKKIQEMLDSLQSETIQQKEGEETEDAIKRAENVADSLFDVEDTRNQIDKDIKEAMDFIAKTMNVVIQDGEKRDPSVKETNNKLINDLLLLKEKKMYEDIEKIRTKFMNDKKNFESRLIGTKDEIVKMKTDEIQREIKNMEKKAIDEVADLNTLTVELKSDYYGKFKDMMEFKHMAQIEKWTSTKFGSVLFDSSKDAWAVNNSSFDSKVVGKKNVVIVIEDTNGNIFGGYISVPINSVGNWTNDENAFLFSLYSNKRYDGMMKFPITKREYAFYEPNSQSGELFRFGGGPDIYVLKSNSNTSNYCNTIQSGRSFSYNGNEKIMMGAQDSNTKFTTKRIICYQMV